MYLYYNSAAKTHLIEIRLSENNAGRKKEILDENLEE